MATQFAQDRFAAHWNRGEKRAGYAVLANLNIKVLEIIS